MNRNSSQQETQQRVRTHTKNKNVFHVKVAIFVFYVQREYQDGGNDNRQRSNPLKQQNSLLIPAQLKNKFELACCKGLIPKYERNENKNQNCRQPMGLLRLLFQHRPG